MNTQWDKMLKDFVAEYYNSPDDFLRHQTIARTVHPNCQGLAAEYYREMLHDSFFNTKLLKGMNDSSIGNPQKFNGKPSCSPLSVQHTYHLNLMYNKMNVFIPDNKITHVVEIGGGYGNLCRLIHEYGYNGKYTIIDFPEIGKIQKDFLHKHSIDSVEFSELDMEQIKPSEEDVSILIATFSINEMPMETREMIEPYYKDYDYLFFAHNTSFDGINNMEYFNDLKDSLESVFYVEYVKDKYKNSWFMMCQGRK